MHGTEPAAGASAPCCPVAGPSEHQELWFAVKSVQAMAKRYFASRRGLWNPSWTFKPAESTKHHKLAMLVTLRSLTS